MTGDGETEPLCIHKAANLLRDIQMGNWFGWGDSSDDEGKQKEVTQMWTLTHYRGAQVSKEWTLNKFQDSSGRLFWFDDADGKRVVLAGTFVYEPSELVEIPEDIPITHRVTLFQDAEPIRTFRVDMSNTSYYNGAISWKHPVTRQQIIVSGTFTCIPIDLEPDRVGHYKPLNQISLFQAGKQLGSWGIRPTDFSTDSGMIWFTDDFSRLQVIISGDYSCEPHSKPVADKVEKPA